MPKIHDCAGRRARALKAHDDCAPRLEKLLMLHNISQATISFLGVGYQWPADEGLI